MRVEGFLELDLRVKRMEETGVEVSYKELLFVLVIVVISKHGKRRIELALISNRRWVEPWVLESGLLVCKLLF